MLYILWDLSLPYHIEQSHQRKNDLCSTYSPSSLATTPLFTSPANTLVVAQWNSFQNSKIIQFCHSKPPCSREQESRTEAGTLGGSLAMVAWMASMFLGNDLHPYINVIREERILFLQEEFGKCWERTLVFGFGNITMFRTALITSGVVGWRGEKRDVGEAVWLAHLRLCSTTVGSTVPPTPNHSPPRH